MQLTVEIRDPYGVTVWRYTGPVTPGYGAQLGPEGQLAMFRGQVAGNYAQEDSSRVTCEVIVTVAGG